MSLLEEQMKLHESLKRDVQNNVDHPRHYQGRGLEVIDVIDAFDLSFNLGNAVKYILRAGKKGIKREDLEKAKWYLQREIDHPQLQTNTLSSSTNMVQPYRGQSPHISS